MIRNSADDGCAGEWPSSQTHVWISPLVRSTSHGYAGLPSVYAPDGLVGCTIDSAIPYPNPPLTGTAFVLRPFREEDFGAALELEQDEAAARWVPTLPAADGAEVVAFYNACRCEGSLVHLVIADRASDSYLGETMLALTEHSVGEVGCCLVPEARGSGIATEALRLLTDWAFAALTLGRVQVFVAPENVAALELAGRAGFRREGLLRSYWELDGERLDVVVLARVPGEVV